LRIEYTLKDWGCCQLVTIYDSSSTSAEFRHNGLCVRTSVVASRVVESLNLNLLRIEYTLKDWGTRPIFH